MSPATFMKEATIKAPGQSIKFSEARRRYQAAYGPCSRSEFLLALAGGGLPVAHDERSTLIAGLAWKQPAEAVQ